MDDPICRKNVGNHLLAVEKDRLRVSLDTTDGIPNLSQGRRKEGGGKHNRGEPEVGVGRHAGNTCANEGCTTAIFASKQKRAGDLKPRRGALYRS